MIKKILIYIKYRKQFEIVINTNIKQNYYRFEQKIVPMNDEKRSFFDISSVFF